MGSVLDQFLDQLLEMFKADVISSVDYRRFVRYFYDPPPKFDETSAASIWLLGREYKQATIQEICTADREDAIDFTSSSTDSHAPSETATSHTTAQEIEETGKRRRDSAEDLQTIISKNMPTVLTDPAGGGWPSTFVDDFESRIWMTYRSGFPPIPRSEDAAASAGMTFTVRLRSLAEREGFTSDTGWGCMIRSGQSVLASALLHLEKDRDWRFDRKDPTGSDSDAPILNLFADDPAAPFSIHNFVSHGAKACNTHPGHWFGPSATAACIAALAKEHIPRRLCVYLSPSAADIYLDQLLDLSEDKAIKPTLILLGVRLGPDRITPVYHPALRDLLTYPQSLGIAGGRPSSSHYFVGVQSDTFFYLDPHTTQSALPFHVDPSQLSAADVASCHTRRLRGVKVDEMDPSMLLAFFIRDKDDWTDFRKRIGTIPGQSIVHIYDQTPPVPGVHEERAGAVDEVETFDDEDEEGSGEDVKTVTDADD